MNEPPKNKLIKQLKLKLKMNNSEKVKQFTEQSLGMALPNTPTPMTRDQVLFLTRMVCEELMEMLVTVKNDHEDVKLMLVNLITHPNTHYPNKLDCPSDHIGVCCEQIDGVVDIIYYLLNAACKNGLNADKIFNLVHDANIAKRFPDGTFHRNDLGKVIKPPGWTEPDVRSEVEKWVKEGTWS